MTLAAERLDFNRIRRVMDLGCGAWPFVYKTVRLCAAGFATPLMAEFRGFRPKVRYQLVDRDRESLAMAQSAIMEHARVTPGFLAEDAQVEFVPSSPESLTFEDGCADVVILSNVLTAPSDDDGSYAEMGETRLLVTESDKDRFTEAAIRLLGEDGMLVIHAEMTPSYGERAYARLHEDVRLVLAEEHGSLEPHGWHEYCLSQFVFRRRDAWQSETLRFPLAEHQKRLLEARAIGY